MLIAVLKETTGNERRVALTPEFAKKLIQLGAQVSVESGAGKGAGHSDADYQAVGAEIASDAAALTASADIIPRVHRPSAEQLRHYRQDAISISF